MLKDFAYKGEQLNYTSENEGKIYTIYIYHTTQYNTMQYKQKAQLPQRYHG